MEIIMKINELKFSEIMKHKKNQRRTQMKTANQKIVRSIVTFGMLALGMIGLVNKAQATAISSNNATALTITITPNVDRGVEISSAIATLNLGSVDMNFSTKTVFPATITIVGNISSTELTLLSTITAAGLDSWNFDDAPLTVEADQMAVWSLFSGVSISSVPTDNEFVVYNATVTQSMVALADQIGDALSRFEGGWTGSDMDSMTPQTVRHLWTRMRTPSSTSRTATQAVVFTLTVQAAN